MGFGLLNYSNIFISFFNTLKIIYLTGWSRTAILMKQKTTELFAVVYYLSFLYLLSYIYMNIFNGMMMLNEQDNIQ